MVSWDMRFVGTTLSFCLLLTGCRSYKGPGDPGVICTAIAVSSLNVTVRDASTGVPICDAAVTAVHNTGTTWGLRQTGDCRYAGPEEVNGVFAVHAARAGYTPSGSFNVVVTKDECHVIPVSVAVDLRPGS